MVLIFMVVLCIVKFFCGISLLFWNKVCSIWNGNVDRLLVIGDDKIVFKNRKIIILLE